MTSLAWALAESRAQYPDRVALRQDNRALSYAELDDAAARLATLLAERGVGPADRVGLMLPNIPEFAICYFGILRAGGVVVPISPLLNSREVQLYLADSGATTLIAAPDSAAAPGVELLPVDDEFPGLLAARRTQAALEPRADEDVAVLLYTSGTSGTSGDSGSAARLKGAELTHANLRHNAALVATTLLELTPEDVVMGCLPLFEVFGQSCGLNAAVCSGAGVTLLSRFSAEAALEVMRRDRVTVFEGVPTMFAALLTRRQHAADAATVRLAVSGGAALPVETLHEVEESFGFPILEGYGLVETSSAVTFNHPDRPRKPGSIGTPVQGVRVRLVDGEGADVPEGAVGEIAVRGHNVMRGYHNRPEATREAIPDGWFRTGDLARRDEDGYYFIVNPPEENS
jgi:long-chain acyl-CoA synthetase